MTMTNQKIQYTEEMVGQNHATKTDTLNRLCVGVNNFRLIKSGGNLTLEACNGNLVDINGNVYAVTSIPTLAASGLTPDTTYYIYLYSNSGTATLEASATAATADSVGRLNKTGDSSRRLMGMARCVTGPAWIDTAQYPLVLSRDNRKPRLGTVANATDRSTASGTPVELNSSEAIGFLAWADSLVLMDISGRTSNTTAGAQNSTYLSVDTTALAYQTVHAKATGYLDAVSLVYTGAQTEGYHGMQLYGSVDSGTGSWFCRLSCTVL